MNVYSTFGEFGDAADRHRVIPFPVVACAELVISFHGIPFIAVILYDSAVRKPSAWRGVTRVTSIFRLRRRWARC